MTRILLLSTFLLLSEFAIGQSAFINKRADDYFEIERMDILRGQVSDIYHSASGSISRKRVVKFLEDYLQYLKEEEIELSDTDEKEIKNLLAKNYEWSADEDGDSDYQLFDLFYTKRAEFFSIQHDDFSLAANPILNYQQMAETGNLDQFQFQNRKGIEVRATIKDRIGIYSSFTDNQERGPAYFQRYIKQRNAVPGGVTYYKDFKPTKKGKATDYILANGYVDAELIKNTVNVSFGHDRFQIGDGYRSLFLSDFGSNYLFARINTKFWKVNYQNLFMELTPQYLRGADQLLPKKYAAMHHLSFNAAKWLNIGLFESIIFSRKDHFEFQYLNPVILYRSVEQSIGSPDNALLGLNFKINPNIKAVFYGQFLLDEFKFSEITSNKGWWANKYAAQGGIKMADLFGIQNLYVQTEINIARPFMYSYNDGIADYTHYNQPLAHPYGANFEEVLLNITYKPDTKLYINFTAFYNRQGRDSSAITSFGGNIFKSNLSRVGNYGNSLLNGYQSKVLFGNLNLSYEVKPNLFFDLGGTYRSELASISYNPTDKSIQVYGGLRWNTNRRKYDF